MSLKKLASLATQLDAEGKTKAASLIDAALEKIAQDFPEWEGDMDWDDEEPSDQDLMMMEMDPDFVPEAQEKRLDEAKANRMKALMTEMALFDEAVRSGQLTDEDKEVWDKIQSEFGELMSSMGVGFGTLSPGSLELEGAPIAEA